MTNFVISEIHTYKGDCKKESEKKIVGKNLMRYRKTKQSWGKRRSCKHCSCCVACDAIYCLQQMYMY